MSISLSPARAAASRKNGAKSHGPRSAAGKARSARNALKHGLCAQKHVLLADEDARAFAALEAAVTGELAPDGAMQTLLVGRIVRAAWRLERAERIEAELFAFRRDVDGDLALALIRDGNGTRSFDTLMRYRGSALAEFFRALRTLQALQAEASPRQPNKPKARANPGDSTRPAPEPAPPPRPAEPAAAGPALPATPVSDPRGTHHSSARRNKPKSRANPGLAPVPPSQEML